MRRLGFALAATLLLPSFAHAGTYDVVMCGAPGAGGVNRSWQPLTGSFGADPNPYYAFDQTCDGGLSVFSKPQDGLRAPWLTFAFWRFAAPAGTTISAVQVWRFGEARDDRQENGSDDDHWTLYAHDENGNQIGGGLGPETCHHGNGVALCDVGAQGGGDASRSPEYRVTAQLVDWGVLCGGEMTDGCQTSYGIPLASMTLYGARVTLTDESKPSLTLGGPLLAGGWRTAGDDLGIDASDNSGIRSAVLRIDGAPVDRYDAACDSREKIPCPNLSGGRLRLNAVTPAVGTHAITVTATDAAGNETTEQRQVQIDSAAPRVRSVSRHGRTIRLRVGDSGSGFAHAELEMRRGPQAPFEPLASSTRGGVITARVPRGRVGLRISAADAAGNVAAGQVTRIQMSAGRHAVRRGRVLVRYGRGAVLRGRVLTLDRVPVAGASVDVVRTIRRTGATPQLLRTLTTGPDGRFAFRAAPGPSRQLRFAVAPTGDTIATARAVSIRTAASTTITASPRALAGPGTVTFHGRLRTQGQPVPRAGKLVDLQAFDRGRWRTFGTARARGSSARWRLRYTFGGTPGSYPIRARVRREAAWPFELGYSRRVVVRVG